MICDLLYFACSFHIRNFSIEGFPFFLGIAIYCFEVSFAFLGYQQAKRYHICSYPRGQDSSCHWKHLQPKRLRAVSEGKLRKEVFSFMSNWSHDLNLFSPSCSVFKLAIVTTTILYVLFGICGYLVCDNMWLCPWYTIPLSLSLSLCSPLAQRPTISSHSTCHQVSSRS